MNIFKKSLKQAKESLSNRQLGISWSICSNSKRTKDEILKEIIL